MKKYWVSAHEKLANTRRARRSLEARLREPKKKGETDVEEVPIRRGRATRSAARIEAPEVLSYLHEPARAAEFFGRLRLARRNRDVFVDLRAIRRITPDAIAVLVANVKALQERRIWINGNYPEDGGAALMIQQSGFNQVISSSHRHLASTGGVIVRRDKLQISQKAEPDRAKRLIDFAAMDDPTDRQRLRSSYGHLMECMANTHEHAHAIAGGAVWWASVFKDTVRHCDCFTFIDMGMGIFESQEFGLRLTLSGILGTKPFLIRQLLEGKIRSSTNKGYRGRGLPGMFDECKLGNIRKFTITTSDVIADVANDLYMSLPHEFKGVLLYWEVPHGSNTQAA